MMKSDWKRYLVVALGMVALGVALGLALSWGIVGLLRDTEEAIPRSSTSYGWFREEQFVVAATGTNGTATGSQTSDGPLRGHVYAVHLDYASGISTTTDITVTLATPALTILQLSDYYTDTWYYPAIEQTNSSGSGLSVYDQLPVSGRVSAEIAETTVTNVVTVTMWWGD